MKKVNVPYDLVKNAHDALMEKTAEVERLELENKELEKKAHVLQEVFSMVEEGIIDPYDIQQKVAQFTENPSLIQITKQAAQMGVFSSGSFGNLTPSDNVVADDTPESKLRDSMRDIINPNFI